MKEKNLRSFYDVGHCTSAISDYVHAMSLDPFLPGRRVCDVLRVLRGSSGEAVLELDHAAPTSGVFSRIRSQKKSRAILEIPEIPEKPVGLHCMSETAKCGDLDRPSKQKEARGNRGNALIGESVQEPASHGSQCRPSQIAQIAEISRGRQFAGRSALSTIRLPASLSRTSPFWGQINTAGIERKGRRINQVSPPIGDTILYQSGVWKCPLLGAGDAVDQHQIAAERLVADVERAGRH